MLNTWLFDCININDDSVILAFTGQLSDELEHKISMMDTSLNRLGMILDSVQADIMQVNKGTKELSLEGELCGTRKFPITIYMLTFDSDIMSHRPLAISWLHYKLHLINWILKF